MFYNYFYAIHQYFSLIDLKHEKFLYCVILKSIYIEVWAEILYFFCIPEINVSNIYLLEEPSEK